MLFLFDVCMIIHLGGGYTIGSDIDDDVYIHMYIYACLSVKLSELGNTKRRSGGKGRETKIKW